MNQVASRVMQYQFFQKLCQLPFVQTIYLFGSRARGDALERSDIDLALECPEATHNDWLLVTEIIANADTLLKIDCIQLHELTNSVLKRAIENNHIVLYTRVKNG